MKARMVENLNYEMVKYFGYQSEPDTRAFYDSISGKEIELTFTCGDAFEKEDNNHWLPNHTWSPASSGHDK